MKEADEKGVIFNIQRFSIHDGPGIRTTIFLKGCALRCKWCSNPESINPYPELMVRVERCTKCGKCEPVCPQAAISLNGGLLLNRERCNLCMKCVDACPTGALTGVGEEMSVGEVMEEAKKDELFYRNSGGGITLSGGEPLLQWKFALSLMEESKRLDFHTALDTCGYAEWGHFEKVLECTDLVLFDIKHLDPEKHLEGTGVKNDLILKNLDEASKRRKVWVRIPIIPGYNDSEPHMRNLADLLSKLRVEKVSLLPYHEYGKHKYGALGLAYPLDISPPSEEELRKLEAILSSCGLRVTIGY